MKTLADDQCSSVAKDCIYHIKHMSIQPFTIGVDLPEIGCLIEVSTMFYIGRYCVSTWYGRIVLGTPLEFFLFNLYCFPTKAKRYLEQYSLV